MSQAGIIDVVGTNPSIPTQFDANTGFAVPLANILNIVGGTNVTTTGSGNTITIDASGTLAETFDADSGSATASAGIVNINGSQGVTTLASGNTITIQTVGIKRWVVETTTSRSLNVNEGVMANNAGLVTCTLPSSAAFGDEIRVSCMGSGLAKIAQQAGQQIVYYGGATTSGTGGSLTCLSQYGTITITCIVVNTTWQITNEIGTWTTL